MLLEVFLGQASGRRLGRNGTQSFAMLFSLWVMVEGCAFGRTLGATRRLCVSFPSLYALVDDKEALVADLWDSSRDEGGWTPRFIRPFNDWELDEILSLLNTIQGKQIIENQEELMFFKETKNGNFLVKLLFKAMDRSANVVFPYKFIWNSWVPTKVSFFLLGKPLGAKF